MGTYPPVLPSLYAPHPISDRPVGIGVSTPWTAVSTRENSIFLPGVLKL